jgi:NADP-dependent 3-hydroxy acid dehydrogenase YdfG
MFESAWVTGAGKGIGRALAKRLAEHGTRVAVSARTFADLDSLVAETAGRPGRILPFALDVTNGDAMRETVNAIHGVLDRLDLVVLNAGTHRPAHAAALDPETFEALWRVNVMGVVNGLAAVLPRMIEQGRGHVGVVASVAGYTGLPTGAAYGATKAALINLCEALKPELDIHGVRISIINPGFVRTPLTDRNDFPMPFLIDADEAAERIHAGLLAGRYEIAFPRRMVWLLKALAMLPAPLRLALKRRMIPR